jgi:hypothetical protein
MRQRLSPGGVAVYNIHDGTQLYLSTLKTLSTVFSSLHLHPSGEGEIIAIAIPQGTPDRKELVSRAAELQKLHKFRYPLPKLLAKRAAMPRIARARVLTDAVSAGGSPASDPAKAP